MFVREYSFDEIKTDVTFSGAVPESIMFDRTKHHIFNSDIALSKWKTKPKIGDTIKYLYEEAKHKHPDILHEIFVNNKSVWRRK